MNSFIKKCLPYALALLFSSHFALGQERRKYKGSMQIGQYKGNALYEYITADNDTIFDGTFQVRRSSLEALLEHQDASFSFKGNFDNGVATDEWRFQFGKFQSNSESKVVDYEYRVLISGMQSEGRGALKEGRPEGDWTYTVNRIKESKVEQSLFKSSFIYENGIPQQNFRIESNSHTLVGRYLRDGLAHDEWSSFSENAIEDSENWYFDEGILKEIRITKDGETRQIPVFNISNSKNTIPLDENYLRLLQATLENDGEELQIKEGIAALLQQNEMYYRTIDTVLMQLGQRDFFPKYKVKVPYYPLDSIQKTILNNIVVDYQKANAISQTLLSNSHLNIIRRSDAEVQFRYQVTDSISKSFLIPLKKVVDYTNSDILQYLDLSKFIEKLWPKGRPNTAITVTLDNSKDERVFTLPQATEYNFTGNSLRALQQIAAYSMKSLEQIQTDLASQLTNEERLQMLNGLEEELISANNALVAKIDTVLDEESNTLNQALQNIKDLADTSLLEYATIKSPEEKLAYGTNLKACLGELSTLADELMNLPKKEEEILAAYKDSVWNPFMATVMDEEVKKRITTAYSNVLIPYFVENSSSKLDCENAADWRNQIRETNRRMLELREEDTRKLERKLRKQKDPKTVLELLHQKSIE